MTKEIPSHKCNKKGTIMVSNVMHKNGTIKGTRKIKCCSICGLPTESK